MNKNEIPCLYGSPDKKGDDKKYVKLRDIFVVPKNNKISSDIEKMDKELKKSVNTVKSKKSYDTLLKKEISKPKEEIKKKNDVIEKNKNYDDSMVKRNMKCRTPKNKHS